VRVNRGLSIWRCRTAIWWRSAKISMSFSVLLTGQQPHHGEHARHGQVGQSQQHGRPVRPPQSDLRPSARHNNPVGAARSPAKAPLRY